MVAEDEYDNGNFFEDDVYENNYCEHYNERVACDELCEICKHQCWKHDGVHGDCNAEKCGCMGFVTTYED